MTEGTQRAPEGHLDYGERVAFPVEIVGNDGVVRRHPFLSAVELYERRIEDSLIQELAGHDSDAVQHCRKRIQQLRNSFFLLHGWESEVDPQSGDALFGDFAGQVAGLLATLFPVTGSLDVAVRPVTEQAGVYTVEYLLVPLQLTLRVAMRGSSTAQYGELVALMEREEIPTGDEVFVAATCCRDGVAVVSATPSARAVLVGLTPPTGQIVEVPQTPWTRIRDALSNEAYPEVYAACRALIDEQVYHRRAFQTAALAATYSNQFDAVEDLCVLGLAQWPGDPDLRGAQALHAWRSGDNERAREALRAIKAHRWCDVSVFAALVGHEDGSDRPIPESPAAQRVVRTLQSARRAYRYYKYAGGVVLAVGTWLFTGTVAPTLLVLLIVWVVLHITYGTAKGQAERLAVAHILDHAVRGALLERVEQAPETLLPS